MTCWKEASWPIYWSLGADILVAGGNDGDGLRVAAEEFEHRVGDARGGIASARLGEDLFGLEHRELFQDEVFVGRAGHNQEVFVRDEAGEAFVGQLDERLADAQGIDELLRFLFAAEGPETGAYAARHNDTIVF